MFDRNHSNCWRCFLHESLQKRVPKFLIWIMCCVGHCKKKVRRFSITGAAAWVSTDACVACSISGGVSQVTSTACASCAVSNAYVASHTIFFHNTSFITPPHPHPFTATSHSHTLHYSIMPASTFSTAHLPLLSSTSPAGLFHLSSAHEKAEERDWRWCGSRPPMSTGSVLVVPLAILVVGCVGEGSKSEIQRHPEPRTVIPTTCKA